MSIFENMNYYQVKPVPLICPCRRIRISVLKASDDKAKIIILIYFRLYDHDTYILLAIRI